MKMVNKGSTNRRNRHRPFWEKTCLTFYKRLTSRARRLTKSKNDDAVDLVQETVLRVLFYSPDPRTIRTPLRYLYRVLHHVWTDKWSRERRGDTDSLEQLQEMERLIEPAAEPDVLRILENEDLLKQFSDRRGPLTPREDLLLTKHLEGYSCGEIAVMLGEDKRVTRSDLNAVRVKVRHRLRQKDVGPERQGGEEQRPADESKDDETPTDI
jgi:DNA-directed RNA polymerase specialized sigma24 family protein